ncbi:hypothetical protein PoB_007018900 [Plakobranchus ocellatus]|uniref:Uncharacterized protein n=1 Tax=Plakobranchus ocellatus TaxID=259542 RepID=A0AAV4DHG6_9GAST|nr:hypothetical protein PoB_007018900 [Plakobranchus ocellatus]
MSIQVSVFLLLATYMLSGFLCESSRPSCKDLNNCARGIARKNVAFYYFDYSLSKFQEAIDWVCTNKDFGCLRRHRCTDVDVLNNFQRLIKERAFLCSDEGREETKMIRQEDKCYGKPAASRSLNKDSKTCWKTYRLSLRAANCKAVEQWRNCVYDVLRKCSERMALFIDRYLTYRVEAFWPTCVYIFEKEVTSR